MKIFGHWFLVKRPYTTVLKRAKEFMKQFPPGGQLNDERSLTMRRTGFEDGYVACLKDLGINQTIENIENKKNGTS